MPEKLNFELFIFHLITDILKPNNNLKIISNFNKVINKKKTNISMKYVHVADITSCLLKPVM